MRWDYEAVTYYSSAYWDKSVRQESETVANPSTGNSDPGA